MKFRLHRHTASLFSLPLLLSAVLAPAVHAAEKTQYIDDEISVTVRDAPRNDGGYLGVIKSGDRVTVLESLGPESFARVRTASGTEGWITARFLSDEPAAKDQLDSTKQALNTAEARIKELEQALGQAQGSLDKARPALELAQDNDRLKGEIAELQRASEEVKARFNEQKARRKTMLTSAGLIGAGVLGGLILPWLGRTGRRRRYSEF
ncbi:TIGR04211 family SH3 domain-containing protein [Sinimarinibacterium sp. CAU 1509]|uniref:TIGR04211 family SH3 domain-containing protein n=1 Tax=Sinimarinibacterium sp. CAU 1509 TaxID=2562283 RepID=UPI0010AC2985|nr:TIGR04211 family SH3 domain-containing protein [Sinimarinibacterium sp. CAU 1509]TJY58214.1 TIGR04211 family SH3 domain-containing protein [Sinimarinibacterium sp. CAU 1509]